MIALCQEVHDFISACETIHEQLAQGDTLTSDEKRVVALAANDVLNKVMAISIASVTSGRRSPGHPSDDAAATAKKERVDESRSK
jgi:hypothetical protein